MLSYQVGLGLIQPYTAIKTIYNIEILQGTTLQCLRLRRNNI